MAELKEVFSQLLAGQQFLQTLLVVRELLPSSIPEHSFKKVWP